MTFLSWVFSRGEALMRLPLTREAVLSSLTYSSPTFWETSKTGAGRSLVLILNE